MGDFGCDKMTSCRWMTVSLLATLALASNTNLNTEEKPAAPAQSQFFPYMYGPLAPLAYFGLGALGSNFLGGGFPQAGGAAVGTAPGNMMQMPPMQPNMGMMQMPQGAPAMNMQQMPPMMPQMQMMQMPGMPGMPPMNPNMQNFLGVDSSTSTGTTTESQSQFTPFGAGALYGAAVMNPYLLYSALPWMMMGGMY